VRAECRKTNWKVVSWTSPARNAERASPRRRPRRTVMSTVAAPKSAESTRVVQRLLPKTAISSARAQYCRGAFMKVS
jgi:hypothetical protein